MEVAGPDVLDVRVGVRKYVTSVPGLFGVRVQLELSLPIILLHLNQLYRA